jgi:outer membrane protein OmpU
MNNLKKLGLTALASSLVASTAFAGTVEVTGTAKVVYKSQSGSTSGTKSIQGNPWSDITDLSFTGSGELDNGMTVSYYQLISGGAFSSSSVSLDMGDVGMVGFGNGGAALGGIDTIKDKMPTAGEEVWDDQGTGDDAGVTDLGSDGSLFYKGTFGGITASASYARTGLGTENSVALVASDLVEGAEFGIGTGTNSASQLQAKMT